jgi:uroporphyrinogen decarboxylase
MLIDAVRGKKTPVAPWAPYAGVHSAFLIGEPADKYLQDPKLIAKGVVNAAEKYQADGIPLTFDLSVEATSMGCGIKWWPDNVPSVTSHPVADKTLAEVGLKIPGPNDGRWPVLIEAAKIAKPKLDEMDCVMMGLLCGPLTLGAHLSGVRMFTDVIKNKDRAHELLKFCGEVGAEAARIYRDMGCDIIAIVDPVSSQIRDKTFREFVTPNSQPAIKVIREAGLTSTFFCCGDATVVMDAIAEIGTDGFAIDEQLNLSFVRDVARKNGVGFGGNLKLTLALSLGILSPRDDAIVSLAIGGTNGYTFAPG